MSKAYLCHTDLDNNEHSTNNSILQALSVNSELCQLNMACITSTALSLCWNGDKLVAFTLERGLRQEDPLSPYLFVLCMEVLGSYVTKCVESKTWSPVCLSRDGQKISYIFFTDDLLLFGEASLSQARVMEHVLAQFYGISEQRVSRSKSRIWFLMNTLSYLQNSIYLEFRIQASSDLGT